MDNPITSFLLDVQMFSYRQRWKFQTLKYKRSELVTETNTFMHISHLEQNDSVEESVRSDQAPSCDQRLSEAPAVNQCCLQSPCSKADDEVTPSQASGGRRPGHGLECLGRSCGSSADKCQWRSYAASCSGSALFLARPLSETETQSHNRQRRWAGSQRLNQDKTNLHCGKQSHPVSVTT